MTIPYRIEVCSGWADDLRVNSWHKGLVLTMSIHPEFEVQHRSGLASSTHDFIDNTGCPLDAKIVANNDIGSGPQDAYGICFAGLVTQIYMRAERHPLISPMPNECAEWFSQNVALKCMEERPKNYDPIKDMSCSLKSAFELYETSVFVMDAILEFNYNNLITGLRANYQSQLKICPAMYRKMPEDFLKWSGAGCGGYYLSTDVENGLKYKIRFE